MNFTNHGSASVNPRPYATRKTNTENPIDPADGLLSQPETHVHPEEITPSLKEQERTQPQARGDRIVKHKRTIATILGLYLLGKRFSTLRCIN
jgi:hypothetical protein